MTKKVLVLMGIILFTSLSMPAKAQQNTADIKGTVVEKLGNNALGDANVRLLSVSDSTIQTVVTTGEDGSFTLKNVRPGRYILHVTFMGFEPIYMPVQVTVSTKSVYVETLEMEERVFFLDEVIVEANMDNVRRFLGRPYRTVRRF